MNDKLRFCVSITVYSNSVCREKEKQIFARVLYLESIEGFPFDSLYSCFRLLFGSSCIVLFETSYLEK